MQLSCIHCGQAFTITKEQLGGSGQCPHCDGSIRLPRAEDDADQAEAPPSEPSHWLENSISGLVSIVLHMALLLILALIGYNSYSGEGLGEDVLIGELPSEQLSDAQEEELSAAEASEETADEAFEEMLEVEPEIAPADTSEFAELAVPTPSSGGGEAGSFDIGTITVGGGSGGGSWDGLLQNLRRHGLDIVIAFDSTSSMEGEIREVKQQIQRIGDTLVKLVPKARIGLVTYRDHGDRYVAQGLPLTSNIQIIAEFLRDVEADGGGDIPEAVQEGLRWAVERNQFRGNARKVILLFGDAPPHAPDYETCKNTARDFHVQQKGIVSTVTCRQRIKLPEFEGIAQSGGGEAFLTADEREIMTQLLVLVFGSRYRSKVVDAFKLMER